MSRVGPSIFQTMGLGPAQPITFSKIHGPARPITFSNVSARPGPAHHKAARPMKHGLYTGRPDNYVGRPVDLKGRPMARFFVVFSLLDSAGQLHLPMRHIP